MKFSIITAVKNGEGVISQACQSLYQQINVVIEHIVVDGKSSDRTVEEVNGFNFQNLKMISEPDLGTYEALNKGMLISSGDIIGILHADDVLASEEALVKVAKEFENGADAVYADLKYVSRNDLSRTLRMWKSGTFTFKDVKKGWMPPHPTFFFKKSLLTQVGYYDTRYSIASDYDYMLRFLINRNFKIHYLQEALVLMRIGGKSNKGIKNIVQKSVEDYKIMRKYFSLPCWVLFCKNFRKIRQLRIC